MSQFFIHPDLHDQIYIPAASISARDIARHLQTEFPGQIFAIIDQSGFSPRCARLIEGTRDKINFGMVEILPGSTTAETELLIDGQFMRLTSNIT